jgi:hypothetical protein
MMSSGVNPFAAQRCPSGRAYSSCAPALSGATAAALGAPDYLSELRFSCLPNAFRLPAHPLGSFLHLALCSPEPQSTTLETEQNPLKTGTRAKV